MCAPLTPHDDDVSHPAAAALDALHAAELDRLELVTALAGGGVDPALGEFITRFSARLLQARLDFDRALCTLLVGEPYRALDASVDAVTREAGRRLARNRAGRAAA